MREGEIEAEFIGTVSADPVARVTKTGKPWLTFKVTVGSGFSAQRIRVALFGDSVADAAKTIVKGKRVHIHGRLQLATWHDDNGKDHSSLQVTAWQIGPHERTQRDADECGVTQRDASQVQPIAPKAETANHATDTPTRKKIGRQRVTGKSDFARPTETACRVAGTRHEPSASLPAHMTEILF